ERAAGVYHREARSGKYRLTFAEARAVCEYEGGRLATLQQLEAARKIGLEKRRAPHGAPSEGAQGCAVVSVPSSGALCKLRGFLSSLVRSRMRKECGGVFTDSKHVFKSPGYPNEYENEQVCYWHIRVRYGQRIHLQFLEFDVEEDTACLADFLEVYDSYDDVNGFVGR
ncbi:TSG6 protein, partial [Ploceus nigricollis]|nr:TSG6 protein [Ploceus nigricollis]